MMKYQHAKKNGVTLVMIVAITKHQVFLLDWIGNHSKGKFTEILFEFSVAASVILSIIQEDLSITRLTLKKGVTIVKSNVILVLLI